MMNEELIKQIFFYCKNNDPKGLYTDPTDESLDILEFARKIEAVVMLQARDAEHARLVEIAKSLNPNVARVLEEKRL
jgi:hypothetical protein